MRHAHDEPGPTSVLFLESLSHAVEGPRERRDLVIPARGQLEVKIAACNPARGSFQRMDGAVQRTQDEEAHEG